MGIHTYFHFNVLTQPDPTNPQNTLIQVQPGAHGLFSGGIIMDVVIGVDTITAQELQSLSQPIPSLITTKALVDTGCTITSIDTTIASNLQLVTRGIVRTHTANGPATVRQHQVSINFPGINLRGYQVLTVQEVNLTGQQFGMLIGRDIMSHWSLTYNGTTGFVCIAD